MPTKIDWCHEVWNPITGCDKISDGCRNCYAQRLAFRLKGRCGYDADEPFKPTFHADKLNLPLKWKTPKRIFVNSMGDLLHDGVKTEWLQEAFNTMRWAALHTFIILTKRPENYHRKLTEPGIIGRSEIIPNVWWGVTAENQEAAEARIPRLLRIPAAVRFVSAEPLLEQVDMSVYLRELNWVIAGGETGPGARPMHPLWPFELFRYCNGFKKPFYFKGFGAWSPVGNYYQLAEDDCLDEALSKPHILLKDDGEVWDESVGQPPKCYVMRRTKKKEMNLFSCEYREFPQDAE